MSGHCGGLSLAVDYPEFYHETATQSFRDTVPPLRAAGCVTESQRCEKDYAPRRLQRTATGCVVSPEVPSRKATPEFLSAAKSVAQSAIVAGNAAQDSAISMACVPHKGTPVLLMGLKVEANGETATARVVPIGALSKTAAAEFLGVSPRTVDNLVTSGALHVSRVGEKRVVFRIEELYEYLESHIED